MRHGHGQALKAINGAAPTYPAGAERAGVPSPPGGLAWTDISYVIGGYTKAANFVDGGGYVLTDGTVGAASQYNLSNGAAGLAVGFVPFRPEQVTALPFEYGCFRCHVTGAQSVEGNGGRRQGGRPGIGGTWAEEGVGCEVCHGPGSAHVSNPVAGNIHLDGVAAACAGCHAGTAAAGVIEARDGFIVGNQQHKELTASPHVGFSCTVCHNPHASITYDRSNGRRNACGVCHAGQNMALHGNHIFVLGDYVEPLTCESCHMPPASKNASSTTFDILGSSGRIGDTRTHLFYVNTVNGASMFTPDGSRVALDETSKAGVTVDYVCLRCHNGKGSAFELTLSGASAIARGIHEPP